MTSRWIPALALVALVTFIVGCGNDDNGTKPGEVDTTPPAAVTDLAASTSTSRSVTLTWTAVGDDGANGTASQYDIRFSTSPSTEWDLMTPAAGEPAPRSVGQAESFTVMGLAPDTTYHFVIDVADEVPNWSGVSNTATGMTLVAEIHDGMVWIPAGDVSMGQADVAEPIHTVHVESFYIDILEVSNAEYKEFIDAGGYQTKTHWDSVSWAWREGQGITLPYGWTNNAYHGGGIPGNESFPVNGVSWFEASAYARWAGKRLPTEAEWERAAKGGCEIHGDPGLCEEADRPTYPWGEGINTRQANYHNSGDPYERDGDTTPIGYYDGSDHGGFQTIDSPSPFGLYDVIGNVWEWCSTKKLDYPYVREDGREKPPAVYSDSCRVVRGGSWYYYYNPVSLRCAYRAGYQLDSRLIYCGFRCARSD